MQFRKQNLCPCIRLSCNLHCNNNNSKSSNNSNFPCPPFARKPLYFKDEKTSLWVGPSVAAWMQVNEQVLIIISPPFKSWKLLKKWLSCGYLKVYCLDSDDLICWNEVIHWAREDKPSFQRINQLHQGPSTYLQPYLQPRSTSSYKLDSHPIAFCSSCYANILRERERVFKRGTRWKEEEKKAQFCYWRSTAWHTFLTWGITLFQIKVFQRKHGIPVNFSFLQKRERKRRGGVGWVGDEPCQIAMLMA